MGGFGEWVADRVDDAEEAREDAEEFVEETREDAEEFVEETVDTVEETAETVAEATVEMDGSWDSEGASIRVESEQLGASVGARTSDTSMSFTAALGDHSIEAEAEASDGEISYGAGLKTPERQVGGAVFARVDELDTDAGRELVADLGVRGTVDDHIVETGLSANYDEQEQDDGGHQDGFDLGIFTTIDGERGEGGITANLDDEVDDGGRQGGLDLGFYVEGLERSEVGATVNIDTDTEADGDEQTGIDLGLYGESGSDRVEAGSTVNFDDDHDSSGQQVGLDAGFFLEGNDFRTEAGATMNTDVQDTGDRAQITVDIGLAGEADDRRAELAAMIGGAIDQGGDSELPVSSADLIAGGAFELDGSRGQVGAAAGTDLTHDSDWGDPQSELDIGVRAGGFAQLDDQRADLAADVDVTIEGSPPAEGSMGWGVSAGVVAAADDVGESSLDVYLKGGAQDSARDRIARGERPFQNDIVELGIEAKAGDHHAGVGIGVNHEYEEENYSGGYLDLGLTARADEHIAEAGITAGSGALGWGEVGVYAEADDDRSFAGIGTHPAIDGYGVDVGFIASTGADRAEAGVRVEQDDAGDLHPGFYAEADANKHDPSRDRSDAFPTEVGGDEYSGYTEEQALTATDSDEDAVDTATESTAVVPPEVVERVRAENEELIQATDPGAETTEEPTHARGATQKKAGKNKRR